MNHGSDGIRDHGPHRILLRYTSGSKAGEVDEFHLDRGGEIILGLDRSAAVSFDPDSDDMVSSEHARIFRESTDPGRFMIIDLGSANGTYVNRYRAFEAVVLSADDVVHLGAGGVRFEVGFDPLPEPDAAAPASSPTVAPPTAPVDGAIAEPAVSSADDDAAASQEIDGESKSPGGCAILMVTLLAGALAIIIATVVVNHKTGSGRPEPLMNGAVSGWALDPHAETTAITSVTGRRDNSLWGDLWHRC